MGVVYRLVDKDTDRKMHFSCKEYVHAYIMDQNVKQYLIQMREGEGMWLTVDTETFLSWFSPDTTSHSNRTDQYRVTKMFRFMEEPPHTYYFNTLEDVASCIILSDGSVDGTCTVDEFIDGEWTNVHIARILAARVRNSELKFRLLNLLNGDVIPVTQQMCAYPQRYLQSKPYLKLQIHLCGAWIPATVKDIVTFLTDKSELTRYILKKHDDGVRFMCDHTRK